MSGEVPTDSDHAHELDKDQVSYHEFSLQDPVSASYARDKDGQPTTVVNTMGQDPEHASQVPLSAYVVIFLVALGQLNNSYLGVSAAVAAGTASTKLGAPDKSQWIVQAQGIPSIVSGPIIAVISDVYGRKYAVLGFLVLAIVACIICIITTNIDVLILGQTINGISAGIIGLFFAIPSEVVPSRYRSIVQGINSGMGFFGVFVALMSTGAAITADPDNGWRWVWRTQLIFNGILLLGFAFVYRPPPRTEASAVTLRSRVKELDWIGYFLLTGGLVPLLMGFAWASLPGYGWSDPHASACVAVGFASFIACGIYEWKGTSTGFLHHALFKEGRNFPLAVLLCAVEGDIFYLINNIYTGEVYGLWFTTIKPLAQNACLLPFYGTILLTTPIIAWYTVRTKDLQRPLIVAFALQLVGVIGLGTTTATSTTRALVFNGIMGIGFAGLLMLLITVIQFATPPLFIGVASALAISSRTLGGTIGYGIALVIDSAVYEKQLPRFVSKAVTPLGFDQANLSSLVTALGTGNSTLIAQVEGASSAIVTAALSAKGEATAYSYGRVWYAAVPSVALGIVAMFLIKNPAERMDWVVDAPLAPQQREHHEAGNSTSKTDGKA